MLDGATPIKFDFETGETFFDNLMGILVHSIHIADHHKIIHMVHLRLFRGGSEKTEEQNNNKKAYGAYGIIN